MDDAVVRDPHWKEMAMFRVTVLAVAAMATTPLFGQTEARDRGGQPVPYDLGRDNDSVRSNAGALESRPGVIAANRQALADSEQSSAVIAGDQERYAADVEAYRATLRANAQTIANDAVLQARRERAYALAMEDWRAQVWACDHGNRRACEAPAPDPASYW